MDLENLLFHWLETAIGVCSVPEGSDFAGPDETEEFSATFWTLQLISTALMLMAGLAAVTAGFMAIRRASRKSFIGWTAGALFLALAFAVVQVVNASDPLLLMTLSLRSALYFNAIGYFGPSIVIGVALLILNLVFGFFLYGRKFQLGASLVTAGLWVYLTAGWLLLTAVGFICF